MSELTSTVAPTAPAAELAAATPCEFQPYSFVFAGVAMAIFFTLLLAAVVFAAPPLVLAALLLELLLLEPQAATTTDNSARAANSPIPRSARFCVRACMESVSPFV